jgi:molybdopterin-guanine dinucleotide biosynthesis protein A
MTIAPHAGQYPLDAVILCGDKGSSRRVEGESKAFLYVHGQPLFLRGALAAAGVQRVRRLFIVGDKAKLDYYLSRSPAPITKPVITIEQKGTLLENVWSGFLSTVDGYADGAEKSDPAMMGKTVLFMPGDTPLLGAPEIEEFLGAADMDRFDYVGGLTGAGVMERYSPSGGIPGIRMAYFHFREGRFRINNLHLARPFMCRNRGVVQLMYSSRYQKDIRNIIHLTRDLWGLHVNRKTLTLYAKLQTAMFLSFIGFGGLSDMVRRRIPMADVAEAAGAMLGMRAGWSVTTRGGAALDVDNDIDYETMKIMFRQWRELQT